MDPDNAVLKGLLLVLAPLTISWKVLAHQKRIALEKRCEPLVIQELDRLRAFLKDRRPIRRTVVQLDMEHPDGTRALIVTCDETIFHAHVSGDGLAARLSIIREGLDFHQPYWLWLRSPDILAKIRSIFVIIADLPTVALFKESTG